MPTSNHISSLFKPRIKKFIPSSFTLDSWESLKQYYQNLLDRKIESLDDLRKWMLDRSELESFIEEDLGRFSCLISFSFSLEHEKIIPPMMIKIILRTLFILFCLKPLNKL